MTATLPHIPLLDDLVEHSLAVIEDGQAPSGAYVASPTFPTYDYSWFRDGAFIADAMSRYDRVDSTDRFHAWCAGVIADRADQITDLVGRAGTSRHPTHDEHLRTRYTLDGREADGFWENFQLDGYGTWLWALRAHAERHGTVDVPVDEVTLLVSYLTTFWEEPSYDWWEEHLEQVHVSTLASIWAGLDAVADWPVVPANTRRTASAAADAVRRRIDSDGVIDNSLTKWLGSTAVDASLLAALTPFGLYEPDHPVAIRTTERIVAELSPAGVHRYLDDVYYGGGQWILLTAFLAWHLARTGRPRQAWERIAWVVDQARPNGDLPEQVANDLLAPEELEQWEQRWGPSACPLLWSHAMLLSAVHELRQDAP